jgi:hypothetical protein
MDAGKKLRVLCVAVAVMFSVVLAQAPVIVTQPESATVEGRAEHKLFVEAKTEGGGVLTYQWYMNSTASTVGGRPIAGATNNWLIDGWRGANVMNSVYYYVVVTSADAEGGGSLSTISSVAEIARKTVDAAAPLITTQPQDVSVKVGDKVALSVSAVSLDGGMLSYHWSTPAGGIDGATDATFFPSTDKAGTFYYEVAVRNMKAEANGERTNQSISRMVTVVVASPEEATPEEFFKAEQEAILAIQTPNLVIPQTDVNEGIAIVAPVNILTAAFTAGPNPASKSLDKVGFFRQGKLIKSGQLIIYNASGRVINKIRIDDKAIYGDNARRMVGSWNLTDRKGRPVSEGTYLVKGTITTPDGQKERVSVMVSVR